MKIKTPHQNQKLEIISNLLKKWNIIIQMARNLIQIIKMI